MDNQSAYWPVIAFTPQGEAFSKLIRVTDALARRGAVSHAVEQWTDDLENACEIGLTVTAVFGASGEAMKAEHQFLVEQLEMQGFVVNTSAPSDIGDHDVHVTASMRVTQPDTMPVTKSAGPAIVPLSRGTPHQSNLKAAAKCTG